MLKSINNKKKKQMLIFIKRDERLRV